MVKLTVIELCVNFRLANHLGILSLHAVAVRRAGSRTMVRLALPEWTAEVEVFCFLGWVTLSSDLCKLMVLDANSSKE